MPSSSSKNFSILLASFAGQSIFVGNLLSKYLIMSLLSICTSPLSTRTGTTPLGFIPKNQSVKLSPVTKL